jgi:hypothetical protein
MKNGITYKPQKLLRDRILQDLVLSLSMSLHKSQHPNESIVCWDCQARAIAELEDLKAREGEHERSKIQL